MPTKPSTLLLILAIYNLSATTVHCAPAPAPVPDPNPDTTNQINNSYSGAGGHASGGSVTTNPTAPGTLLGDLGVGGVIDIFSGNGGPAGSAKSGPAVPGSGLVDIAGPGSAATTDPSTGTTVGSSGSGTNSIGNAYSGAGGVADGGSVSNEESLIRLFSGNGGRGGNANSGPSGLLSGAGLSNAGSTPKRGGRTRVTRFYKVTLD